MIRVRPRFLFGTLLVALSIWQAQAAVVDQLYQVAVPVKSQSPADRKVAIDAAFATLLIRVTGDSQMLLTPVGVELMTMSEQYLHSFRYEVSADVREFAETLTGDNAQSAVDVSEGIPPIAVEQMAVEQLVLSVLFDENSVKEILWEKRLPVWGKTRPSTLVWIAIQQANSRRLLDVNESSVLLDTLKEQAQIRGLPLVFPLMDLEDQVNIKVTDIWGNFGEPILAASRRYQTEAVLIGRLLQDAFGAWQARWILYQDENSKTWEISGMELNGLAQRGVDLVADNLASRYAHVSNDEGGSANVYDVMIKGVLGLEDYVRTTRYLSSLAPVAKLDVARVERAQVLYRVVLRGQRQGFEQAIKLGATLASAISQTDQGQPDLLNYRLLP